MQVTLPLDMLIEIAVLIGSLTFMWAMMKSEIKDLRRQVEEHGPDVRKISPMGERLDQFEKRIDDAVARLRSDMKGVAASIQELALAVAKLAIQ